MSCDLIGVIACGARKSSTPQRARHLYKGSVFQVNARWIDRNTRQWVILSAKYHVVDPNTLIPPYEESLFEMDEAAVKPWAAKSNAILRERFAGCQFISLLNDNQYRLALENLPCVYPLDAIKLPNGKIGYRMQWLNRNPIWKGGQ